MTAEELARQPIDVRPLDLADRVESELYAAEPVALARQEGIPDPLNQVRAVAPDVPGDLPVRRRVVQQGLDAWELHALRKECPGGWVWPMDFKGWLDVEVRRAEPALQKTLPAPCGHVRALDGYEQHRREEKRAEANADPV
jgi:hypothetical protein